MTNSVTITCILERAQTAEMKVEELEERIRALERAMSRGKI